MKPGLPRFLAGALIGLAGLLAGGVHAADSPVLQLDGLFSPAAVDPDLAQTRQLRQAPAQRPEATVVVLTPLSAQKAAALNQPANPMQPVQIGVGRAVAQVAHAADMATLLTWVTAPDGTSRAALGVRSPGARGLRLALQIEQLPPGTVLRTYGAGNPETFEVSGNEVLQAIQQNVDAGIADAEARTYWMPPVEGEEGVLEIELAAGVDPQTLKVALPQLSHLVMLATDERVWAKRIGDGAYCNVDLMCTAHRSDNNSLAVAHMQYVSSGGTYICTGTLMNNTRQDFTPYFLSANHCISTQSEASSLVTYWDFRASSCNSGQLYAGSRTVTGGAQLLYASSRTDTSFMRLRGALPSGRLFAGWDARTASASGSVYGIHHPKGDLQMVSEGQLKQFLNCTSGSGDGTFTCMGATSATGGYLNALWSSGTTEGGSSGSALFNPSGQIVGQLYGGSSSCSNPAGSNIYGRLDLAFNAALKQWLAPDGGTAPAPVKRSAVYRFYNATTQAHFYTNSAVERDSIINNNKQFKYEGTAFYAPAVAGANLSPVYRFYNRDTGVHFYTLSKTERDKIINTMSYYKYEGPTWYAQATEGSGATAMYRFYSRERRAHFYTTSRSERDKIINTMPYYKYEGIAYYAWTTP